MSGHTRVLWVTDELPDRGLGGGSIRQSHLFEALASSFPTDLLVVGEVSDERVRSAAAGIVELPDVHAPWTDNPIGRRLLELAIMVASPYPSYAYPARPARRALVRAMSSMETMYDLVCVEHAALAPLEVRSRGAKSLLTFHHLFSGTARQELTIAAGGRQRLYRGWDLRKAQRLERRALQSFDLVAVCSEEDATALAEHTQVGRSRIEVIPNGVDLSRFRPGPLPDEPRILFPGTLDYGPNVDGVLWFCAEVWPRIRAQLPSAELEVVGRSPVEDVLRLARLDGITVHADVLSMAPYYERARVVVVPLRFGTGTRLKALEAMAAGRPIVGTTIGLEGIGVADGREALIADEPSELAAKVVNVLRDRGLASGLARCGRSHVEQRFGWARIANEYVEMVAGLLNGRPERSGSGVTGSTSGT